MLLFTGALAATPNIQHSKTGKHLPFYPAIATVQNAKDRKKA